MSANDELQAHTCEKMLRLYENQSKTSKNSMLEVKNTSKEISDLTEQWKKGELKKDKYWVKYRSGKIDIWELSEGTPIESRPEIVEVLAPVPSYEEWKQLRKWCEEFNALDVAKENQQLKELLKECQEHLCYHHCERYTRELSDRIDNAIGEK